MAQELNEIQDEIMGNIMAADDLPAVEVLTENEQSNLGYITSTSKVGVLRKLVYVFAKAALHIQELWDLHRTELEERIAESRPFTKRWYQETALAYQHGYDLDTHTNDYEVPSTPQEEEAAEASKKIKKAAVVPTVINNVGALRLKIAGENNGELEEVSPVVLDGFQEYIEQKGAAGVYVVATTGPADDLKLVWKIYYDALILDNEGRRLDGTDDTPVQTAIKRYLKNTNSQDFNGKLSLAKLVDEVQKVNGVVDPFLIFAASKYGAYNYTDSNNIATVGEIEDYRQPDSGYFKLDEVNSEFEFIPA